MHSAPKKIAASMEGATLLGRSSTMRSVPLLVLLAACGAPSAPQEIRPPVPASLPFTPDAKLAESLDAAHFAGAFAYAPLGKSQTEITGSDHASCMERRSPASTFKVPHALFALDRGVVTAATTFPGVDVPDFPAWRETLDLKGALAVSSVPWFQQVATKLGAAGEQELVDRFDYGDRQIGADVTHFWLGGKGAALHISPIEQVRFLDRLYSNELPLIHAESAKTLLAVLPEEQVLGADGRTRIVRGKTGWAVSEDQQTRAAWYIGIVLPTNSGGEKPGTAFALVLDAPKRPDQQIPKIDQRKPLAFALLKQAGRL